MSRLTSSGRCYHLVNYVLYVAVCAVRGVLSRRTFLPAAHYLSLTATNSASCVPDLSRSDSRARSTARARPRSFVSRCTHIFIPPVCDFSPALMLRLQVTFFTIHGFDVVCCVLTPSRVDTECCYFIAVSPLCLEIPCRTSLWCHGVCFARASASVHVPVRTFN